MLASIAKVQLNGSAGNAWHIQQDLDSVTNGRARVWESTHQDDFVGTMIGGNPATGGIPSNILDAHGAYGPSKEKNISDKVWGRGIQSISFPVEQIK